MNKYFGDIWAWLFTALVGMKITFLHLFEKNVTIQYPKERFPIPQNARNRLFLDMNNCNGCNSCARACPVNCIEVVTLRVTPDDPDQPMLGDGSKRKLWVPKYEIDFAKCCFCSLCTTVCPTEAVKHTTEFEYSKFHRKDLVYKFQTLTPEQVKVKEGMLADFLAKEKAAKAAAAAKAVEVKPATNLPE